MKKRILSLGLLVVFLSGVIAFPACGEKKPPEPPLETVTVYGGFYRLSEAYEKEFLTNEDLDYINENENKSEAFEPLTESQKEKILHDYKATHPIASEQLEIKKEYGVYRGNAVVYLEDPYYENYVLWDTVNYYHIDPTYRKPFSPIFWQVWVWKEYETPVEVIKPPKANGEFYSLKKAYEYGFVTEAEVQELLRKTYKLNECPRGEETDKKIRQDYLSFGIDRLEEGFGLMYYGDLHGYILIDVYAPYLINVFYEEHRFFTIWHALDE